jgi:TP901 family phage tail tape measure protein
VAANDLAIAYVQLVPSFDRFFATANRELGRSSSQFKKFGAYAGTAWSQGFASTATATTPSPNAAASPGGGGVGASTAATTAVAASVGAEFGAIEGQAALAGAASAAAFAKGFGTAGAALSAAGTGLTAGITVPLVAVGVLSAKAAIDFESAFAGVRKTVNATEQEFGELERGLRDLAVDIPLPVEQLARFAELGGQFNIPNDELIGFSQIVGELGVTLEGIDAEQAALQLAQFAAITKLPTKEIDNFTSALVGLGNNFETLEGPILQFALRLAGQGTIIGLSAQEILAFSTALSSVGVMPEAGGTAFSRVFQRISDSVASGSTELKQFAAVANLSTDAFANLFNENPAEAINEFTLGLGLLGDETTSVTPLLEELGLLDVRVRDGVQRLAISQDKLGDALSQTNQFWEENIARTEEATKRFGTTESQLALMRNRLNEVGIELGNSITPAIVDLLEAAQPLVNGVGSIIEAFGKLPQPIKTAALGLGVVAAAAGPVSAVAGLLSTAIGGAIGGLGAFVGKTGAAGNAAAVFGSRASTAATSVSRLAQSTSVMAVAAKGAGLALATFFVSDMIFDALNVSTVKKFNDELNRLKVLASDDINAEINLSSLVAAEQNTLRIQNLWEEFGAEIDFGDNVQADIEQAQRALEGLAQVSPEAALRGLDELQKRTDELDSNSDQYRKNTEFIDDNRRSIELAQRANEQAADAQEQQTDAIGGVNDAYRSAVDGPTKLAASMDRIDSAIKLNEASFAAGAAAAAAYKESIERATFDDDILSSSLDAGESLRGIRVGAGLEVSEAELQQRARKAAQEQDKLATEIRDSALSADGLTDALDRLNPALRLLKIESEAASAAGAGFRSAMEQSTALDNIIGQT